MLQKIKACQKLGQALIQKITTTTACRHPGSTVIPTHSECPQRNVTAQTIHPAHLL
jgi:hypothetical protein